MTLGEKLQRLRRARGLTQEQLAEKVGVSRQSLSGWENDTALPDTANVLALADLFGVTTDYLLRPDGQVNVKAAPEASPAAPRQSGWRMPARELGARLIVASALIGLIVLRICASFHPADVGIDGREYTGYVGFLYYYDLWWLRNLLLIVLALGLVQWIGPWLWKQGARLIEWAKE